MNDTIPNAPPQLGKKDDRFDWIVLGVAIAGLLLVAFLLQSSMMGGILPKKGGLGKLSVSGPVFQRHAGSLSWRKVRSNGVAFARDYFFVPAGTEASIDLGEGRTLAFEPDTMVQLLEAADGSLWITTLFGKSAVGLPTLASPVRPRTRLKIKPLGKETAEPPRAIASLPPPPPPTVRLLSPETDQVLAKFPSRFEWAPLAENATYRIEISKREDFRESFEQPTNSTWFDVVLSGQGQFYWRVEATVGGKKIYSSPRRFVKK